MFSMFSLKKLNLLHKYVFFLACGEVSGTFLSHFCISDAKNRTEIHFTNDGAAICRPQNEKCVDFAGSPIASFKKSNTFSFYEWQCRHIPLTKRKIHHFVGSPRQSNPKTKLSITNEWVDSVLEDLSPPQARKIFKICLQNARFLLWKTCFRLKNTKIFRPAAGKSHIKGPPFICFFGVSDLLRNKGGVCCSD